ncbi:hypothetical protein ONZ45_g573 [Pleurotus djamor]|nr:hypothetical protein ONZ45_g573 [Pleurotus djamor]
MSLQNLNAFDPFAEEADGIGNNQDVGSQQSYIHIRVQQRNGRKTLTTLQGLPKEYDPKKLLKAFKKVFHPSIHPYHTAPSHASTPPVCSTLSQPHPNHTRYQLPAPIRVKVYMKQTLIMFIFFQEFACNGTLVEDEEMGQVIQLQGDQRLKISNFLIENGLEKRTIKVHGF